MGRYKKGIETKNNITNAAKSLFYLQGLNSTTVQKIADLASVNLGLLSYYFKTKNNIIIAIYSDFLNSIRETVLNELGKDKESCLVNMVIIRIFYDVVFSDSNNLRFFRETIEKDIIHNLLEEVTINNYINISESNGISIEKDKLKTIAIFESGGRINLLKNYFNNNFEMDLDNMLNTIISNTPKLLCVNKDEIHKHMVDSKKIQESMDYSKLKLLI
ncbi:transcriptional regulator, TetR family [Dethiosulfatibacter aminovorans DSM 17477]|uniref:Transcriptional regulator, TetR family n=1 Tax=Dethiosulfatibacter aminovorans DSM 17477 TaxID=1121476 RepID=A0A1M6CXY7_9FIRM|nr:TetR family transcriptional regulator [Dethiosulfatibacter aminovorans]SHI65820.1 transcriptional regulator, TetR family [Dethiosulfatibacter aminovorans DSM 17477]